MNLEFLKKGQVKVEIKTFDINKLLNVLWRNGINVENVRKIDVVTLTLNVDYSDYVVSCLWYICVCIDVIKFVVWKNIPQYY